MARLFHITVADLLASVTRRLQRARVHFGHGTDNAADEAFALVFHALKLEFDTAPRVLKRRVTAAQRERAEALLRRRIDERIPLPYLTHEAWFAGLRVASREQRVARLCQASARQAVITRYRLAP